jgi:hypothetical protein
MGWPGSLGILYADQGKQSEAEQIYSIALIGLLSNFVDKSKGCNHSHRPKATEVRTIREATARLSDIFCDDGFKIPRSYTNIHQKLFIRP